MSKMFPFINKTWNPVKGCEHDCIYCWARGYAEDKLKRISPRYHNGFKPTLIEKELNRKFKKGDFVFVTDMGDLFGGWAPINWIVAVFECIKKSPEARFLLLTKDPGNYKKFLPWIPKNCILGATIETNRIYDGNISKAPSTWERYKAMRDLDFPHKFWCAEPIIDFDLDEFVHMFQSIPDLEMVAIGYDNYNNDLPEPSLKKTQALITNLEKFVKVYPKTLRERRGK